jgi:multiple sugar transport system substrate-binding protein
LKENTTMLRPLALALWFLGLACSRGHSEPHRNRLVFVHQPLGGNPAAFEALLDEFRRAHPELELVTRLLPNSSDVAHQYFLTALEGRSQDFDVLVVDVVWVPEFARAGWIADLSADFPADLVRSDFLPGPAQAVILDGKVHAVPWYLDVGVLYYRTDLVPRAPATYEELREMAASARALHPELHGFVWQGRQYEGLVCNVYEAIWGHGGQSLEGGRLALDSEPARQALQYLRGLITSGISPPMVTSAAEEEARQAFQSGRAVFMRNWPYAFGEAQREGSPIRGKVAIAPLPTVSGEPGYGTLGGWQLAVNAHAPRERRAAALALIAHLTSEKANLTLALEYGRNPPRRAVYLDPGVQRRAPFLASLLPLVERARPRPVTPYYNLLSDVLQGEFSAAISGVRSPEAALHRAQARADFITGGDAR